MTRFSIELDESCKLVLWTMFKSLGNEIVIPKMKSYKILDLAKSIDNKCKIKYIGKRPGEKLHEELISEFDDRIKISTNDKFILIDRKQLKKYSRFIKINNGKILNQSFSFNSKNNEFMNQKELKKIIKSH